MFRQICPTTIPPRAISAESLRPTRNGSPLRTGSTAQDCKSSSAENAERTAKRTPAMTRNVRLMCVIPRTKNKRRMGSRQSNTSWCWSPRMRAPEHTPPIWRKSYDDILEEKRAKEWMSWNRWRYSEGRDPNILGIGDCDKTDNH